MVLQTQVQLLSSPSSSNPPPPKKRVQVRQRQREGEVKAIQSMSREENVIRYIKICWFSQCLKRAGQRGGQQLWRQVAGEKRKRLLPAALVVPAVVPAVVVAPKTSSWHGQESELAAGSQESGSQENSCFLRTSPCHPRIVLNSSCLNI